jgi:hypothetical protein
VIADIAWSVIGMGAGCCCIAFGWWLRGDWDRFKARQQREEHPDA